MKWSCSRRGAIFDAFTIVISSLAIRSGLCRTSADLVKTFPTSEVNQTEILLTSHLFKSTGLKKTCWTPMLKHNRSPLHSPQDLVGHPGLAAARPEALRPAAAGGHGGCRQAKLQPADLAEEIGQGTRVVGCLVVKEMWFV